MSLKLLVVFVVLMLVAELFGASSPSQSNDPRDRQRQETDYDWQCYNHGKNSYQRGFNEGQLNVNIFVVVVSFIAW